MLTEQPLRPPAGPGRRLPRAAVTPPGGAGPGWRRPSGPTPGWWWPTRSGTVVSYEALCAHPEWPVTDYVTIGCPLAGDLIRDRLDPCPSEGLSPWPGSVLRWTNIVNPDDPAARTTPCGRFRGDVIEYKVDNGHRVHDPEPYLNNRWTGQAVAAGLAGLIRRRPSAGPPPGTDLCRDFRPFPDPATARRGWAEEIEMPREVPW